MKFIAKNLNLIGLLLFTGFAVAAAGLYFGVPQKAQASTNKSSATQFTCPMHANVVRNAAGNCPECGMKLIARASGESSVVAKADESCCESEPAAPAAAMTCPHLASLTNAAPAEAGCCPHQ